ncbi:MAG: N(6)-L-threonylcarbamoyladenine synthase Kae1 [Candidatus Lokiarchaeota archaeon]|nr:N(6)-L-threonylcarbamoyladenine synthase Kae1 [Candidatus Lokiarchaeota archaeon]
MENEEGLCLGIESTAHTWSVGIVDFSGEVYGLVNNTYIPEEGGLHPALVREHHLSNFKDTVLKALQEAKCSLKDISLIAFSQSPGLGPILRIGSLVARLLSQLRGIPIVGVNHCVAHIEIGRLMCNIEDPLTLYVSGGNTIISAYESARYQIFGETLDISIGNMIDMVARDAGLAHPGGPKIEKLAEKSNNYISLPYIVKGMDLTFSGLYTAARKLIESDEYGINYVLEDVAHSLQETSFSMLTEITERALAHTKKTEVLLTGGVAANKRLQEMIKSICEDHGARYEVVPLKLAGDNGAMIAWTGILRFKSEGGFDLSQTNINPKERMDNISIPWRK